MKKKITIRGGKGNGNGWAEWSKHVLSELSRLGENISCSNENTGKSIKELNNNMQQLNTTVAIINERTETLSNNFKDHMKTLDDVASDNNKLETDLKIIGEAINNKETGLITRVNSHANRLSKLEKMMIKITTGIVIIFAIIEIILKLI